MNGESLVESHGRPHTGTKTLRRCNDGLGADHVILIDVELTESFSNVSFIDVPESKPKSWSPFGNIILIDDDDESNENEYSEFGADDDHCFFHDLSPSMRSCSTSKSAKELRDEIDDDCQFVGENVIPLMKLSKCKRTYSGKVPVQNRHGLMSDDVNGSVDGRVGNCITTQRERIKETSEYKKALEEELMSRQRALAIQAEEAKKLKLMLRRKKSESRRLLEMEERQKQRDIDNMNLKEPIQAEVQKELSKLEMTCHDMASVLRGLGINVGDGTSHEVRVAYKKMVLKFHPDRASQSDIRQQVEAEEKLMRYVVMTLQIGHGSGIGIEPYGLEILSMLVLNPDSIIMRSENENMTIFHSVYMLYISTLSLELSWQLPTEYHSFGTHTAPLQPADHSTSYHH
ncbi:hypothetical protein CQW23_12944 [Capsicum baccatum]|uniref:J domain-containing protein n=1 Tax=Capsicum baccatum TaxID=33114 RepID=A0A2G2WTZ9_CAPBA|nr:hypothetical protein CQW23_12944 [Capsicum baccatum]